MHFMSGSRKCARLITLFKRDSNGGIGWTVKPPSRPVDEFPDSGHLRPVPPIESFLLEITVPSRRDTVTLPSRPTDTIFPIGSYRPVVTQYIYRSIPASKTASLPHAVPSRQHNLIFPVQDTLVVACSRPLPPRITNRVTKLIPGFTKIQ